MVVEVDNELVVNLIQYSNWMEVDMIGSSEPPVQEPDFVKSEPARLWPVHSSKTGLVLG